MMPTYRVSIIKREFQMSADDYHATVTRIEDGAQLIFIASWRRLLKWRVRPKAIARAFKDFDKNQELFAAAMEEYVV